MTRFFLLSFASIVAIGCNAVLGLTEGSLDDSGQGGGVTTKGGSTDAGGPASASTTGDGSATTSATSDATSSTVTASNGGGVHLDTGNFNVDFADWEPEDDEPYAWNAIPSDATLSLTKIDPVLGGIVVEVVGDGAMPQGFLTQTNPVLAWTECLRIHGTAAQIVGAASTFAHGYASMREGALIQHVRAPVSAGAAFDQTCMLTGALDAVAVQLEVSDVVNGQTVTVGLLDLAIEHVTCGGGEPACALD